jgi:hypothetical protein
MKISKQIRFTVRIREYETVSVEVSAEASHYDLSVDDAALAKLSMKGQENLQDRITDLVEQEVTRLATKELAAVNELSEFDTNLADDYISNVPRSQHARTEKTNSTPPAGRGLRR